MTTLRFMWRRRPNWGREVYDARLGAFHVGQIQPVREHGSGRSYWGWSIPLARLATDLARGSAPTPRAAAAALEAAFSPFVLAEPRFAMRAEREVILRAVLQLTHTVELDHALAVERGEHVRPISSSDEGGWRRWLNEERRRGGLQWVPPEAFRALKG